MRTTVARILLIGLLFLVLSGCATMARTDTTGLPDAQHPEYLAHPFRLIALPLHFVGNVLQYGVVEPMYFALLPIPEAVGLSMEEQRYLSQRQEAWEQWLRGERPAVQ